MAGGGYGELRIKIPRPYAKILGETNFHTREFPRSGSKAKDGERKEKYSRDPGGRDRTMAVNIRKTLEKQHFFVKKIKNIFFVFFF